MNYLFSDYISRLAAKDSRLQNLEFSNISLHGADQTLLVEEKQLERLNEVESKLALVVLTESRTTETFETRHRVIRAVYKYDAYISVLANIFQERHPITLFTTTQKATSDRDSFLSFMNLVQSDICCILDPKSDDLSNPYQNISVPTQYLYQNVLDYLDPPIDYVENLILDLSSKKSVDVISFPMDSNVQARLLEHCDVALLMATPNCIKDAKLLSERYANILVLCTDKIDGLNWIGETNTIKDRIIQMRNERKKKSAISNH